MKKNKTILCIGHEGFIGSHLIKALEDRGERWVGYDLRDGQDTRNKHDLECVFELNHPRYVIHLAARTGVRRSKLYPDEYISTNILGTQNVVDMCNKYKVERLVFYSSSSVFGNGDISPFSENSGKNPLSLYGISKLAGEHIVNNAECPTVIVRPFTVYGENGRRDEVIYRWLEQYSNGLPITIYGNGDSCRGYVYVKDLVNSTIDILHNDSVKEHDDFNLGGSEVIYLFEIVNVFKKLLPAASFLRLEMPKEDVRIQHANIDKAREIIGFNPKPNFVKNIIRIINNFKKNAA